MGKKFLINRKNFQIFYNENNIRIFTPRSKADFCLHWSHVFGGPYFCKIWLRLSSQNYIIGYFKSQNVLLQIAKLKLKWNKIHNYAHKKTQLYRPCSSRYTFDIYRQQRRPAAGRTCSWESFKISFQFLLKSASIYAKIGFLKQLLNISCTWSASHRRQHFARNVCRSCLFCFCCNSKCDMSAIL